MKFFRFFAALCVMFLASGVWAGCLGDEGREALRESIRDVVKGVRGEVGVALITDCGDTLTLNNADVYPLMSVFKLHQAVALCHHLDVNKIPLDTLLSIERRELNANTWSPMFKERREERFNVSAARLMLYTLTQSDNNASNLLFDRLLPVASTDSFIATLIPRDGFRFEFRESDMQANHALAYRNHSSPLAAAMLLDRLFNDSILQRSSQNFIRGALLDCRTGIDRISQPLADIPGIAIAHKTGSGYRDAQGRLVAHNDAAHVMLPSGRSYTLVVFVKDFHGDERGASDIISRISEIVYRAYTGAAKRG